MDDRERFRILDRLFQQAVELPAEQRGAFVEKSCAGDPGLRRELEKILAEDGKLTLSPALAQWSGVGDDRDAEDPIGPGDRIGSYCLTRRVGEGGMGVVFEAEQEEPVRRRVALKLIKWGMDTRQVVARFGAERQTLALMSHPGIARVFDAGATPSGRPYFVMEFVEGASITDYCDAERLGTSERLALFRRVCEAVQHAHQKGVVHRDLKPANVLIELSDGNPQPKVIDFGIARAIDRTAAEQSVFTESGQLVGTPEYMSPEQADRSIDRVDTRTDVYALGVLLFELLTGARPFESGDADGGRDYESILRQVRETEPPLPSVRLSTVGDGARTAASNRQSDTRSLIRRLRGDLDWIVAKAIAKEPERRYDSASELAAEISRHLAHEPVLAGPPSTTYRMGKFVRRHRLGFGATVAVVTALLSGTALALRAERIATAEAAERRIEAERADRVSSFLTGLFRVSSPSEARGETITAREILDRGVDKIHTDLADQPETRSRLLRTMGIVYDQLGLYDKAHELLETCLELRRELGDDEQTAQVLNSLGIVARKRGEYDAARAYLEESATLLSAALGPDHPDLGRTLISTGNLCLRVGEYEDARAAYSRALSIFEAGDAGDHLRLIALQGFGIAEKDLGNLEASRDLHEKALRLAERTYEENSPSLASHLNSTANALALLEQFEEARVHYERALEIWNHSLGPTHPRTARGLHNYGTLLRQMEDYDAALETFERVRAIKTEALGEDHPDLASTLLGIARVRFRRGELEPAADAARRSSELWRRMSEEHPQLAPTRATLAGIEAAAGRGEAAHELLDRAVAASDLPAAEFYGKVRRNYEKAMREMRRRGANGSADRLEQFTNEHRELTPD